jgi:hypothetical protein
MFYNCEIGPAGYDAPVGRWKVDWAETAIQNKARRDGIRAESLWYTGRDPSRELSHTSMKRLNHHSNHSKNRIRSSEMKA